MNGEGVEVNGEGVEMNGERVEMNGEGRSLKRDTHTERPLPPSPSLQLSTARNSKKS